MAHSPITHQRLSHGFTLAELLICLLILGVIAVFTIPKILSSQQDNRFNAIAKEDASAIAAAYKAYVHNNGASSAISLSSLTTYLNYTAVDTSSLIDSYPGQTSLNCSSWACYRMANGSILAFDAGQTFGATDDLAISYFYVDPDGVYSGSTTGNSKSVVFFIYYNGRITSQETAAAGSHDVWGTIYNPATQVGKDPAWFRW